MNRILIFSHNPVRDYQSDSMLAFELRSRGFDVWVRQFLQNDLTSIEIIKPDIIVLPEIRNEYTRFLAETAKAFGVKVVVKSCEVGISEVSIPFISEAYRKAIFGNVSIGHCVDLMIVWGPQMAKLFAQYSDVPQDKIVPCGGYQFDSYFTPPPPIEEGQVKHDKPVVLFAAGFAYADRTGSFAIPEAPVDSPIHAEFVNIDQKGRSLWLSAIPKFVEKYGDKYTIQVKPHAGERGEVYEAFLRGMPCELILNSPGFISMQTADLVIHAGSTMAYEAHLMNKPAINFGNICQDRMVAVISPNCVDFDGLCELVDSVDLSCSNANPDAIRVLEEDYYGPVDGKGYVRIADEISKLEAPNAHVPDIIQRPKEPFYLSNGIHTFIQSWRCEGCSNVYFVTEPNREMCKCPFCGIANVKIVQKAGG